MTSYFAQKAQQAESRWLSPLLPSILATVSLIAPVDPVSLATAAECQVTEDGGTIQGMPTWKGTTSNILPLTITVERDIYGGLIPSPVPEVAPYMKSSRFARGNPEIQGIATIDTCLSQALRKSALFNPAMIRSVGKTQAKAHTQVMRVPALPYNGKRQVLTIRTTPQEIGISARYKTATIIIGPVQEIQKPVLSNDRSVSQAVAALPSTVESPSLFGGQPFVALSPLQSALQLPDNESLRMNRTTTQSLHGGNCVSGCP
jgi:hypothetical protein